MRAIADWAFDYERLVIASGAGTAAVRDHALHVISRLIVPLIGHVCVYQLDDELVRSVRRVLVAQVRKDQAPFLASIWMHFVGWMRYHAAPPERRNICVFFDADGVRRSDEFTDD